MKTKIILVFRVDSRQNSNPQDTIALNPFWLIANL
jgi:hypothetical protein